MIVGIYTIGVIILEIICYFTTNSFISFNIIWPLFIASFGIDHWYRSKNLTKVGMTAVYIGMYFLVFNVGNFEHYNFTFFIPIWVVVMLLTFLLQNLIYSWKFGFEKTKGSKPKIYFTMFGSKKYVIDDADFNGFIAINILGGLDFDLTGVKTTKENIAISMYSICGESSITLPKRINILVLPSTLFGDTTVSTKDKSDYYKKTILVKTFSFLCSTDIINKEIEYND